MAVKPKNPENPRGITITRNDHISPFIKDSAAAAGQKMTKIHVTKSLIPFNLSVIELKRSLPQAGDPLNMKNQAKFVAYYHINLLDNIVLSFREEDTANKYYTLLIEGLYSDLKEPKDVHPELFL